MDILGTHGHLISPEPNSGCWLWDGCTNQWGYGTVRVGHKVWKAHRYSRFLSTGVMPPDLVLHRCDMKPCVNPEHLFDGDYCDNMADCISKGRRVSPDVRGEKNGQHKLTSDEVLIIRSSTEPHTVLAKLFGVSPSSIRNVRIGKLWAWL